MQKTRKFYENRGEFVKLGENKKFREIGENVY